MDLLSFDARLFQWINQGHRNTLFDWLMPLVTEFDHWKWFLLAAWLLLFFLGDRKAKIRLSLLVLLVGVLDYSNSFFFKHLFARPRPCNFLTGVHIFWPCPRSFSFPSNHAANIFGAAFFLGCLYRRWSLPLFFIAALVGYSRVYVGEHYPFDVLAGAGLGAVGAGSALVVYYWTGTFLKKNRQGKIPIKEP